MAEDTLTTLGNGTASEELDLRPTPAFVPTTVFTDLTEQIGDLNNRARILSEDTDDLHQDAQLTEWRSRASTLVRQDIGSLLGHLADLGFAWRDIARLIGVTVPAVQKWRRGGPVTGANRMNAAALLAACELIREHYLVQDVASWFEAPIVVGCPITAIDLYADRHVPLVFRLATGAADPEQVLTQYDQDWRERYRSDFEVFTAEDGLGLAIRPKER